MISPRAAVLRLGVTQTLGYASSAYLPAVLAAPMAKDLGLATPTVFAAYAGALLVTVALGPGIGRRVDRHGARGVLILSNLVLAAGLIALALAQGAWLLFAAWALMGLGMALGLYDVAFAGLVGWFGAAARGPITGVTLIAGFASTISWPLTALAAEHHGWRAACLMWAGAQLALALPLHLTLPAGPGEAGEAVDRPARVPANPPLGAVLLLASAFAAMSAVGAALGAQLPLLLKGLGATPGQALAAAALVGPAQVLARLAEWGLARRLHPLNAARIAVMLLPIGAGLVLVSGPLGLMALAALYGAGNGLFTIARGSAPLALFGPGGYGARLGLIAMPGRLSQALAPFAFALAMGISPIVALMAACLACLTALALMAPLSSRQAETA
ncbi:MFS transporter [uncultured Caulobacter sp.]|uniref:MFS transporter n=1 Tax=uncultured Caulobacter sp. TaxID=158749 RepID=UPI00261CD2CE|nr:MFS transporter [uncultured Caulobacter sp.]